MLSGGGAGTEGTRHPPQRQRRRSWGGRHASCGWSEGGSQLLTRLVPRRVATSPVPATDPEHSEPRGAGVRGSPSWLFSWLSSGGDRAPSAPVLAAVEEDALCNRQRAARCPARCRTRHSVRAEPHRVRSRMLSGGGAGTAGKPTPEKAAPPLMRGKARFLRLVRGRLAATTILASCMDLPCRATSSRHISSPSNRP
jgi:hypothetical protein